MKLNLSHFTTLVAVFFGLGLNAQPARDANNRLVDNSLRFQVVSEKVHTRGMMEICISDSTGNCIENLISGFVIRIYDAGGNEIWAGKTAGREEMLQFPKPMPAAASVSFVAFKPYVINRMTGDRIYQDQPIETKYILGDE